ncbi:MAG: hypothetical protein AAF449_15230 [Myxococcota bacterium]
MEKLRIFDPEQGRRLQWSGGLLVTLALCILSGFFIDLMRALALRLPGPNMPEVFAVAAGLAIALLIPIAGACAGVPEAKTTVWWRSRKAQVSALLFALGGSIAVARFAKEVDRLQTRYLAAKERAVAARLKAKAIEAKSPEAKARAEIMAAQAKLLASSADALKAGTKRLTPKVREDAVKMAKLATAQLPQTRVTSATPAESLGPPTLSTVRVLKSVVGPALTEFLLAELIAFVAMMWGRAAFTPIRPVEEVVKAGRHDSLQDVDIDRLSNEAREGLDEINGTWRGLKLGRPAERGRGRGAITWPTLTTRGNGGARIFIGSPQALACAAKHSTIGDQDYKGGAPCAE